MPTPDLCPCLPVFTPADERLLRLAAEGQRLDEVDRERLADETVDRMFAAAERNGMTLVDFIDAMADIEADADDQAVDCDLIETDDDNPHPTILDEHGMREVNPDHAPYCDDDGWLLPSDQWPT